jgi:hypothetical protein
MRRPTGSRSLRFVPAVLLAALVATTAMTAAASPAPDANTSQSVWPPIGLTPIVVATPGPVLQLAFVPDCLNLTQTGCEAQLVASNLRLGTVTLLAPQTPPPYIGSHVVSQSPAAGTLVRRGSAVNISVQPFGLPYRP